MDYTKWTAKDGTSYNIKNMSLVYINNCINMLTRSINKELNQDNKPIFDKDWMNKCGKQYIVVFAHELVERAHYEA